MVLLRWQAIALLVLTSVVSGHPGEHEEHGTLASRDFLDFAKRSVQECRNHVDARALREKAISRRRALAAELNAKRGLLSGRDLTTDLATNHKSNKTGLTNSSTAGEIFTGDIDCVLQAEVTQGPYWVSSELVRNNVVEEQKGVALFADVQVINVNTCQPLEGVYLDFWHANSTGVYSGIVANGNGNSNDATNLNNTFLRGVAMTDKDGVAYFETLVPGHYTGRASHVHILAQVNATVLANNTLSGGHVSHVGQAFFDQSLITAVEATSPYTDNTQQLTSNSDDSILAEEAASMDPFFNYVYLGSDVSDGILAWLTIGIDPTKEQSVSAAATWTDEGGVANANAGMGGGPGGGGSPPNGTMGAPPGSASGTPSANATSANATDGVTSPAPSASASIASGTTSSSTSIVEIVSGGLGAAVIGWASLMILF